MEKWEFLPTSWYLLQTYENDPIPHMCYVIYSVMVNVFVNVMFVYYYLFFVL